MDTNSLCSDNLFISIPLDDKGSNDNRLENLLVGIKERRNYGDLADMTYFILKYSALSIEDQLKIWEVRLILHLFNDKLSYAKKEAVNLNNALYQYENNDITESIYRMNSTQQNSQQRIYPLPKNNSGIIKHSLLVFLLRLKSIPNLNLVTELYKLCYQLRLKYSPSDDQEEESLALNLINLSYDIIAVLTITKNFITLENFIGSIEHDIMFNFKYDSESIPKHYQDYLSNTILMLIISQALFLKQSSNSGAEDLEAIEMKFRSHFENHVKQGTLEQLSYVLKHVPAVVGESYPLAEVPTDMDLRTIIRLAYEGAISVRVVCSTLGLWDMMNTYKFKLTHNEKDSKLTLDSDQAAKYSLLDECYSSLTYHWGSYIYKVYGLE